MTTLVSLYYYADAHLPPLDSVEHAEAIVGPVHLLLLPLELLAQLALPLHGEGVRQVELDADHRRAVPLLGLVKLRDPEALHRLGPHDPARGVQLLGAQEAGEVHGLAEDGAVLDVVDGGQDLLPREPPDDVLVVVPQLQDGALGAVVLERLDDVAVDVGGESVEQLRFLSLGFVVVGLLADALVIDLAPVDIVGDVVAARPVVKVEVGKVVLLWNEMVRSCKPTK